MDTQNYHEDTIIFDQQFNDYNIEVDVEFLHTLEINELQFSTEEEEIYV